ncbi:MAG: glutathione peroxidase [Bacteroidales bacterium]|nr:glutathione peroxidase [Bacteroidales bacterium]MCF8388347.1 glutathione peroxidase [Bacteroidales bacterium]MCF8399087.1 glutathione peroxidase [Bacteroidales bacterium]
MKKSLKLITLFFIISSFGVMAQDKNFHSFTVEDIDGNEFQLANLAGKKILVVNVASKCGLTPQYEDLQKLYEQYGGDDFTIIGFPANNFMNQEPGTDEEIKTFCTVNYGVSFPMMSKISVKGDDIHPLYQWLTQKEENGVMDAKVKWNFQKFAIDEEGNLVKMFTPRTKPMDEEIIAWITE